MTDPAAGLCIPVILGSVRRDRAGIRAARLLVDALAAGGYARALKGERTGGTPY
jgi:hypothetical protein